MNRIWSASSYNPAYEGKLYFEKSGVYYYYDTATGKLVRADSLNADFIGIAALLDVGATNYYDAWLVDNTTFYADVYDDIDIRDSAFFTNWTVAYLGSSAGGLTNADYFIDHDGDGIGDNLERSKWSINSSFVDMKIHGNIRIDHLFAEISYVALSSEFGEILSKTWYVLGVRLEVESGGKIQVINMDDAGVVPAPAVQTIWCQDDLMIVSAKATESSTPAQKFIGLLVSIFSKLGGFTASTCDGYVSNSNTIDFYGTASTILVDVNGRVSMAETEINVEDPHVVFQSVGRTASSVAGQMVTDTVTHSDIYQYDAAKGKPRVMIDANFPDHHDRAYGSEIDIKSHNGDFPANSWQIAGAKVVSDITGTEALNVKKGITNVNIIVLHDIDLIYNLSGRSAAHIEKYGANITSRALTILDGSIVELTSTQGSADVLFNEAGSNYATQNILISGAELPAWELIWLGRAQDAVTARLTIHALNDIRTDVTQASCAALDWYSTGGSVYFDRIEGYRTTVRLEAAGDIFALNNTTDEGLVLHNIIRLTGRAGANWNTDASLTLNAGGDIGKTGAWTYLDVDCDVTIEHVHNLFIDLQKRDAQDMLATIRSYLISYGYTEAAAGLVAQYLVETYDDRDYLSYSDEYFYTVMLNILSEAQLKDWLYVRANVVYTGGDYAYGWVYTIRHEGTLSDTLWQAVLLMARGSASTASIASIKAAFGSAIANEIASLLINTADPYGYIASHATAEDIFKDIYEKSFLKHSTNAYAGTVRIDESHVRAVFDQFYGGGKVAYVQDVSGNAAANGTVYDLTNYLFNMDAAYRESTLTALYSKAVIASTSGLSDLIAQRASQQSNYDKAAADKLTAEAKIKAAQQVIRETEQKQAYLQAQMDALLLQTPLPASQISALNAQITALASTYTTQNALIASGETAVTNANARMAAAQQSMDALNTRIAQINDAYATYSKDGGLSAIVHTEANLKKAYVTQSALTKLYTNSYDIFDVSGLAYYSDGSGMYALNDCILYKAYFVNGALLFNGGDAWYTLNSGAFTHTGTPGDSDLKVVATQLTLSATLLGTDYTLWMSEASGARTVYYTQDGANFSTYAAGRTSVEQNLHEAGEQVNDAAQAISDAEATLALANAAMSVASDLAARSAAYAALLLAKASLTAALTNGRNVLAAVNSALGTLNGEGTYSEQSLTNAVDQAALLLIELGESGMYGASASESVTTAEDLLDSAHTLLNKEQAAWAAAKVDYEAKLVVYNAKLVTLSRLIPGTPQYIAADLERAAAEADKDAALTLLKTFTSDITKTINTAGTGSLDRTWKMVADAQAALESARVTAMSLKSAADTAYETREKLINTHVDEDARTANIHIGEITGEAYVYNEGDIIIHVDRSIDVPSHVELDEGNITLGNIYSERGDITISNRTLYQVYQYEYTDPVSLIAKVGEYYLAANGTVHVLDALNRLTAQTAVKKADLLAEGTLLGTYIGGGSILAAVLNDTNPLYRDQESTQPGANNYKNDAINDEGQDETVHVNGNLLTFVAKGNIGTAAHPLLIEQRDNTPVKVVNADEKLYQQQTANETIGQTAFGTAFGERFEELLDPLRNLLLTGETQPTAANIAMLIAAGAKLNAGWTLDDLRVALKTANDTGSNWYNLLNINNLSYLLALEVAVRYDWLRVDDRTVGTDLDARSEMGGVYIGELTGDLNIGEIYAREDVSLSAPGSVYSSLTADELIRNKLNIETDGSVNVTAISGTVGTSAKPLYVNIGNFDAADYASYRDTAPTGFAQGAFMGGEMNTKSLGGVYLRSEDNLVLNMDSSARHVEVETIRLTNTAAYATGDITVHDISTSATSTLSGYANSLGSVTVTSTADIGTKTQPFTIVSVVNPDRAIFGTVALNGGNVYVYQQNGDAILLSVIARGELILTVPNGSIIDAGASGINALLARLRDALTRANDTQNILDELLALKDSLTNSGKSRQSATDAYNAANLALSAATTQRDAAALAASAADAAYEAALAAYLLDPDNVSNYTALYNAYEAAQAAARSARSAQDAMDAAQARFDSADAIRKLFVDFDAANAALAQAVLDRRTAAEAAQDALNDVKTKQAAYDAALLLAGGNTGDPAVVAAKANLDAANAAKATAAALLQQTQAAQTAAQTAYQAAFTAMKYYSNFDERGQIHVEEAQEAYNDLAKDNGYASGDDALAAETVKLGLAFAQLSAAKSAYDLALANVAAHPGDAAFAAALTAATIARDQAQQNYDKQYTVWSGYDTLKNNLASIQDAVAAAALKLSEVNTALTEAEIENENAKTAQRLASDALAAQMAVNDAQDQMEYYAAKANEAKLARDAATFGSAAYLTAQKALDDAIRRGTQAQHTFDAAAYLASATLAAMNTYEAYLTALAAGSVTTEKAEYDKAVAAVNEAQTISDKINETNAAQDALDKFNSEHGLQAGTTTQIDLAIADTLTNLTAAEHSALLAQTALDAAQTAYALEAARLALLGLSARQQQLALAGLLADVQQKQQALTNAQAEVVRLETLRDTLMQQRALTADLELKQSGERKPGTQQLAVDVLAALKQAYLLKSVSSPYADEADDILKCAKYAFSQQLILDTAVNTATDAAKALQKAIAKLSGAESAYNSAFRVYAETEETQAQAEADYNTLAASTTATAAALQQAQAAVKLAKENRDAADKICVAAALALYDAQTAKADAEAEAILTAAVPGTNDDPDTVTDESTQLYHSFYDALGLFGQAEEADRTARAADKAAEDDKALQNAADEISDLIKKLDAANETVYGENALQGIVDLAMRQCLASASGADSATSAYILALYTLAYLRQNGASAEDIADAEAVLIEKTAEYYQKSNPDFAAIAEKEIEKNIAALADAISARDRALDVVNDIRAQIDALILGTTRLNDTGAYQTQQQSAAGSLSSYYEKDQAYVQAAEAARLAQEAYLAAKAAYDDAMSAAEPNAATIANAAAALAEAETARDAANTQRDAAQAEMETAWSAYSSAMANGATGMQDITAAAAAEALLTAKNAKDTLIANPLYTDSATDDETGSDYVTDGAGVQDPTVQVGGNANIKSGGSVSGFAGGSLSINVGGKLTIQAQGDVRLVSTAPLRINTIDVGAGTTADILAVGGITGGGNPAIKAKHVALTALDVNGSGANISGINGAPILLDAESISLIGGNANVQNKGNTELGNVIVTGTAVIRSGGNVTQLSGTNVRASSLTILASGDITSGETYDVYKDADGNTYYVDHDGKVYTRNLDGSMTPILRHLSNTQTTTPSGTYKGALIVYIDTMSAIGADINIANRKAALNVILIDGNNVVLSSSGSIQTVSATGLISGRSSVMVTALGNIGTPFNYLRAKSGGPIYISDASSEYGLVYFQKGSEAPITLVDDSTQCGYYMLDANGNLQRYDRPGTGLKLTAYFTSDAYLWVGTHEQTAQTEGAAAHTIRVKITAGEDVLFDYDIRIDLVVGHQLDPATGRKLPIIALDSLGKNTGLYMLFSLYIGEAYDGMTFRIRYSIDGQVYERLCTVNHGTLVFVLRNVACEITVTLEPNA